MARKKQTRTATDWMADRLARGLIAAARMIPDRARLAGLGWLTAHVIGPLAGFSRRCEANLRFIWPEMPPAERRRITRGVLNNMARTLIENYAPRDTLARARIWEPQGPGIAAFDAARAAGRPIIIVTAHFGSGQAMRAALMVRGINTGALYRPMNNGYFDAHYHASLGVYGTPILPRDRKGLRDMVAHIRKGGIMVLMTDQFFRSGVLLDFLGQPAPTVLTPAELALRYDALLIPIYGIRRPDGMNFDILVEAPIPHSDPITMSQALNDSLAAQIRARPEQWFWVHRRWKHDLLRRRGRLPAADAEDFVE